MNQVHRFTKMPKLSENWFKLKRLKWKTTKIHLENAVNVSGMVVKSWNWWFCHLNLKTLFKFCYFISFFIDSLFILETNDYGELKVLLQLLLLCKKMMRRKSQMMMTSQMMKSLIIPGGSFTNLSRVLLFFLFFFIKLYYEFVEWTVYWNSPYG